MTARAAGPTTDPAGVMLRAGLLPAGLVGIVMTVGSAVSGAAQLAGAGLGTALVLVSLGTGPLLMRWTAKSSPPAVMAAALGGYAVLTLALGLVWVLLQGATWLSFGHVGVTLVACCTAWLAGEVRAVARLRVLAFGSAPDDVGAGAPSAGTE